MWDVPALGSDYRASWCNEPLAGRTERFVEFSTAAHDGPNLSQAHRGLGNNSAPQVFYNHRRKPDLK